MNEKSLANRNSPRMWPLGCLKPWRDSSGLQCRCPSDVADGLHCNRLLRSPIPRFRLTGTRPMPSPWTSSLRGFDAVLPNSWQLPGDCVRLLDRCSVTRLPGKPRIPGHSATLSISSFVGPLCFAFVRPFVLSANSAACDTATLRGFP